ncbi:hypothetical protein WJ36_31460 [Burkholderia ubonensis]|nr:hypothetical protein WJ29_00990 [Burkholderia ubonensis]KVG87275.1 hypothetical protein WJ36_31460 [Burkholderia ubonensis]OJA66952.1 hypothetical protein BGV70_13415 [Burkholderia ubonensis]
MRAVWPRRFDRTGAASVAASIARGREDLAAVALDPLPLQRTAVLMQRKGAYQTAAARAFIEVALDVAEKLARRPKQAAPASRQ